MKKLLILFLATTALARAITYIGNHTFAPATQLGEGAHFIGNLTLSRPGTYTAASWVIVGNVNVAAPGSYRLVATNGGIHITGRVTGQSGPADLHVSYSGGLSIVAGTSAPTVTIIDDTSSGAITPPPTVVPPPSVVPTSSAAPLVNLSTRARLAPGAVLNPGFVVGGGAPRRVLARAVGPGLARFGAIGVMANPALAVFSGETEIASNDDWSGEAAIEALATAGAFPLEPGSRDAVIVLTLPPGAYTAMIRGVAGSDSGDVLFELYLLD